MKYTVKGTIDLYEFEIPFEGTFDLHEASLQALRASSPSATPENLLGDYINSTYGPFNIQINTIKGFAWSEAEEATAYALFGGAYLNVPAEPVRSEKQQLPEDTQGEPATRFQTQRGH